MRSANLSSVSAVTFCALRPAKHRQPRSLLSRSLPGPTDTTSIDQLTCIHIPNSTPIRAIPTSAARLSDLTTPNRNTAQPSPMPSPGKSPALCAMISRAAASSSLLTCSRTRNAAGSRLLAFSPTRKHSTPADSSAPLAICASTGLSYLPTITSPSGDVGSGSPSNSIVPLQSQHKHYTHPLASIGITPRSPIHAAKWLTSLPRSAGGR